MAQFAEQSAALDAGQLPVVAGHEPVGEIVAVGAGVTRLRVGDRVGVSWLQKGEGRCTECQSGRPLHCADGQTWMNLGGGNAEYMLAWMPPRGDERSPVAEAIRSGRYGVVDESGEFMLAKKGFSSAKNAKVMSKYGL